MSQQGRLVLPAPLGVARPLDSKQRHIAHDKDDKLVFMAESKAWLQMVTDNFPDINFHFTSEFKD